MKRNSIILIVTALAMSLVFAAGTPAGTSITNVAYGNYKDANGNSLAQVTSNVVTTIVSQVAGVDLIPDQTSSNIAAGGVKLYPMDVVNTGNGDDVFDLSQISQITGAGEFDVEIYLDENGNGIIDGNDAIITDTGLLAADESLDIIIKITDTTDGGADNGTVIQTAVTAVSQFDDQVSDSSNLTTTVSTAVMETEITLDDENPLPGGTVTISVCTENTGSAIGFNTSLIGFIPDNTTYAPETMAFYTSNDYPNSNPLTDADDGVEYPVEFAGDFNVTNANSATFFLGDIAPQEEYCVFYQVVVNDGVPEGTTIPVDVTVETENPEGSPLPPEEITGGPMVVGQVYGVTAGDDDLAFADPGDEVTYSLCFTNDGNGDDIFNISYVSNFWLWTFYWDFNGNGTIDPDDILLTDTNNDGIIDLGSLAADETVCIIALTTVPAGTNDGTEEVISVTATSVGNPAVSDSGEMVVTVTAPSLSLVKSVTPEGPQPPGTVLTYQVDIMNIGTGQATQVVITDPIPANTTYVAGSLSLAGVAKTDAADGDSGTFSNNTAQFTIPSLGAGGSTYVTFQVTID